MLGTILVGVTTWLFTYGVAFAVRLFAGLGIGFATYSGAEFLITEAETYLFSNFTGLPVKAYAIMVLAGFDEGLRITLAAFTSYITIRVAMGAFSSWTNRAHTFRA